MNKITKDNYPELFALLNGEGQTNVENLYQLATGYLNANGTKTKVEGLQAIATTASSPVSIGEKTFFARVAVLGDTKKKRGQDRSYSEVLIIFDEDDDISIKTPSPFALKFRKLGGQVDLITNNDLEPIINDKRYIELASEILEGIGSVLEKSSSTQLAASERIKSLRSKIALGKKALTGFFESDELNSGRMFFYKGEKRTATAIGLLILSGLYAHVPLSPVDAKIGPIPMPYPIELIVDIGNATDHAAQGYDVPERATTLTIGKGPQRLALLPDYDTSGAPDTTYRGDYNESKLGLYEMDVPEQDTAYDDLLNDETKCYDIEAKTTGGNTLAFTQSPQLVDKVTVEAIDEDTISICPVNGVDIKSLPQGSVFLYRKD